MVGVLKCICEDQRVRALSPVLMLPEECLCQAPSSDNRSDIGSTSQKDASAPHSDGSDSDGDKRDTAKGQKTAKGRQSEQMQNALNYISQRHQKRRRVLRTPLLRMQEGRR